MSNRAQQVHTRMAHTRVAYAIDILQEFDDPNLALDVTIPGGIRVQVNTPSCIGGLIMVSSEGIARSFDDTAEYRKALGL